MKGNAVKVYAKAIVGAVVAGLAVLYTALNDNTVTAQEYVEIASAVLVSAGAIWAVPNAPKN